MRSATLLMAVFLSTACAAPIRPRGGASGWMPTFSRTGESGDITIRLGALGGLIYDVMELTDPAIYGSGSGGYGYYTNPGLPPPPPPVGGYYDDSGYYKYGEARPELIADGGRFDANATPFVFEDTPAPAAAAQPEAVPVASQPTESTPARQLEDLKITEPVERKEAVELKEAEEKPAEEKPAEEKPKADAGKKPEAKKPVVKTEPRNIDVKEHLNMIFIGHVDAGKSTIAGQTLFLTGCVDKRILEKYEKEAKEANRESWYLSWAMDLNAEERAKGITIEVGKAFFTTQKNQKRITILDAPGHKSYIHNMIAGAAQADIAVLVISARRGEFEAGFDRSGQTREHALLAKTAGVKLLIVLVNKMDEPSVNWSKDRFDEISDSLSAFLRKSGYSAKQIHFIPVSGQLGININDPLPEGLFPEWTDRRSFLQYLDEIPPLDRIREGPTRFSITEKAKDMGTLVFGKLESGDLMKGDQLVVLPGGHVVTILEIGNDEEDDLPSASTGANLKLKVKGVEEEDVHPGYVLCSRDAPIPVVREFDARLLLMDFDKIICPGLKCVMHIHNAVEEVIIKDLIATIDKKTNKIDKRRPRFVKSGEAVIARFTVILNPVCMERFEDFAQFGRFTLRDQNHTVGLGHVLKIVA